MQPKNTLPFSGCYTNSTNLWDFLVGMPWLAGFRQGTVENKGRKAQRSKLKDQSSKLKAQRSSCFRVSGFSEFKDQGSKI